MNSVKQVPFIFRDRLKNIAFHLDFFRVRCGREERFRKGIRSIRSRASFRPHAFAAFSEWDAVVVLPCERLYPPDLASMYATEEIATSISGTAGSFAYMWDHPVNERVEQKLTKFEAEGVAVVISLRFEEWVRAALGLGAELIVLDHVAKLLALEEFLGVDAIVSHTLGWNDVVVFVHSSQNPSALTRLLSSLRLLTLRDCYTDDQRTKHKVVEKSLDYAMFAASYSHLAAGYDRWFDGDLDIGDLVRTIHSATLLVRTAPSTEHDVRRHVRQSFPADVDPPAIEAMPSEMGHYSFSIDFTKILQKHPVDGIRLVNSVRKFIGEQTDHELNSYGETSTVLRFPETYEKELARPPVNSSIKRDIAALRRLLLNVPTLMRGRGASWMAIHRFTAVLVTLLDFLADPVRSSVVRHLARFMIVAETHIAELDREEIDDFCHICEFALEQAIDGVAQFQHDAASLGISGRGGYSRLILAVELYAQDIFSALEIKQPIPLTTFGLRTGGPGSTGNYEIDLAFPVLFNPSEWHIHLHEIAHFCWIGLFGWTTESIDAYQALEKLILSSLPRDVPRKTAMAYARAEFVKTRSIVRELFPNLLVFKLACDSDLDLFDAISAQHVLKNLGNSNGTRALLIAVVLHVLLESLGASGKGAGGKRRARTWWEGWASLKGADLTSSLQRAIDRIGKHLQKGAAAREAARVNEKLRLLSLKSFRKAVLEALDSVIDVLAHSGRELHSSGSEEQLALEQFGDLQRAIDTAIAEARTYDEWLENDFGTWLVEGEVLAVVPRAHAMSRLLMRVPNDVKWNKRTPAGVMMSQLAVVLAFWHRATVGGGRAAEVEEKLLSPLGLVMPKPLKQ